METNRVSIKQINKYRIRYKSRYKDLNKKQYDKIYTFVLGKKDDLWSSGWAWAWSSK